MEVEVRAGTKEAGIVACWYAGGGSLAELEYLSRRAGLMLGIRAQGYRYTDVCLFFVF